MTGTYIITGVFYYRVRRMRLRHRPRYPAGDLITDPDLLAPPYLGEALRRVSLVIILILMVRV
jgi:hypothetical protein